MNVARVAVLALAALVCTSVAGLALAGGAAVDPSATVDHEGDRLTLQTEANATVTGTTTLEPGTEITVTIRSSGSSQPFLRSVDATVGENGSFAATFDLAEIDADEAGSTTLSVRGAGETLTRIDVELVPGPGPEPDTTSGVGDGGDSSPNEPAALPAHIVQVRQGEVAAIPVQTNGASEVTLSIGRPEGEFHVVFLLEDGDGDGEVTLLLNTSDAGPEEATVDTKSEADAVAISVETISETDRPVPPDEYPMALYDGPSTDSENTDVGTLAVTGESDEPDGTGTDGSGDGTDGDGNQADRTGGPAGDGTSPSTDPSVLGLGAIAVVALGIAGAITLLRR